MSLLKLFCSEVELSHCLWRRASKRRMAAETEMLRESSALSIGMRMWVSAALCNMQHADGCRRHGGMPERDGVPMYG